MPNENETNLSPQEKLQKAQGQLNALTLGMMAFLKKQQLSFEECFQFLGNRIAQGWDPNLAAFDYLKEEVAFLDAIGCSLLSLSGDAGQAQAVIRSWPPDADRTSDGFLSFWGISQGEADGIWELHRPVAERLGFNYEWYRNGNEVILKLSRGGLGRKS